MFGYVFHDTNGQNRWNNEDPVVLPERNLYGLPLAELLWERQFEETLSELGWEKIPNWECMFVHRRQVLFLSVYVDDIKNDWKEAEYGSCVEEIWWKMWILTNPTSFLHQVYLGCTQRECKPNETINEQYSKMLWVTYFCWSNRKITGVGKTLRELANKKVEQLYKVSSPCLDDHNSSRKNSNQLENCQKFPHKLSWNDCTWHELVDLTSCGQSVNKACGISHKKKDSGMWQTLGKADFLHSPHERFPTVLSCGKHGTASQTGFVSRLRLCWRSWGLKVNLRRCLVYFWTQNFRPSQWDVQETDSCLAQFYRVWNNFSRLRMDGITALEKRYVQPTTKSNPNKRACRKLMHLFIPKPRYRKSEEDRKLINWVMWIMCPPTHILLTMNLSCTSLKITKPWSKWSSKGRSPTMRHVSRNHRVALDWLFDRINLEPPNPNQICWHQ